jgi:hypothetical protein
MVLDTQALAPNADVWRRALIRARARCYAVEHLTTQAADGRTDFWRVSSNSEPGQWRSVAVAHGEHGLALSCDCPAGQNDRPCVHVALVLREMRVISDPDPAVVVAVA